MAKNPMAIRSIFFSCSWILILRLQVVKAVESLVETDDAESEEMAEMRREKVAIDETAEKLVRRELWCGLGFVAVQTVGFMRLTFWELSWDVMEPICFYVTSIYFMLGYAFFLRTSREPSFEGFFQSRLSSKKKKLMKLRNFDAEKYDELRRSIHQYRN